MSSHQLYFVFLKETEGTKKHDEQVKVDHKKNVWGIWI
jgi:hypothetical protein